MASAPAVRRDRQVVRLLTLLKDLSDGRLQLTFEAGGTFEITRWILGWGDAAEVVRPEGLRKDVASIPQAAANQYLPG
jgi:predicted DNA-binding transcriptional regulator YafY